MLNTFCYFCSIILKNEIMILTLLIAANILLVLLIALSLAKKKTGDTQGLEDLKILIKERFNDAARESRELFAENRKEQNDNFTGLQDSLLKRLTENISMQKEQLDQFSKSLQELQMALHKSQKDFMEAMNGKQVVLMEMLHAKFAAFDEKLQKESQSNRDGFTESTKSMNEELRLRFDEMNKRQLEQNKNSLEQVKELRSNVDISLKSIREDNNKQLEQMRQTVDEKLQTTLEKRLGESFKMVSDRLEQVNKGLGEMQNLASGVGDLKKVLSNVKTRGILGEYQLENILEQLLTPEQYDKNVQTKKGSQANVEFAVKLPGKSDEKHIWLPIDSKFPIEDFQLLLDSYDLGDKDSIATAQKILLRKIDSFAKDISRKYLDPPNTTDFGIMFLPVEGLYAEVLRHPGLFEKLQRDYKITVTGPTTLSALLNSLNMGFRTLAVQKRSSEVWDVLKAVKTEFNNFSVHLSKVQKQLYTASSSLETLSSTRTNAINRKLRGVETLETTKAQDILELPDTLELEIDS
jgi:DNA recombination protein RmuC